MQASVRFLRKPTFGPLLMVLVVIALALTLAPALFGQAYFGTVSGELKDATGAVVTGAKVVLTDQQKGFHFETISDSSGRYLFRSIPPGVYIVVRASLGFWQDGKRQVQGGRKRECDRQSKVEAGGCH